MKIKVVACLALIFGLSGCAQTFYANQCAKNGIEKGTAANANCVDNLVREGQRDALETVAIGTAIGVAVSAQSPLANYEPNEPSLSQNQSTGQWQKPANTFGRKTLCPNGQYVAADRCYLAPDGTYVGGPPSLAPDGSYVGGTGPTTLCPNGSYVRGKQCRLLSDGSYVGEN